VKNLLQKAKPTLRNEEREKSKKAKDERKKASKEKAARERETKASALTGQRGVPDGNVNGEKPRSRRLGLMRRNDGKEPNLAAMTDNERQARALNAVEKGSTAGPELGAVIIGKTE
jgi:hypothetical protein